MADVCREILPHLLVVFRSSWSEWMLSAKDGFPVGNVSS